MSWVSEVGKCAQAWHAFERLDPQQGFGLGVRQRGKVVIGGTREMKSPKRRSMAPSAGWSIRDDCKNLSQLAN